MTPLTCGKGLNQLLVSISSPCFPAREVQWLRALLSRFTGPASLLGWPALTLPNGMSKEGLPTGVQLVGRPDSEDCLLVLGHRLEEALGWVKKFPIEPRFP
jgi:Asp-tRNA(Asn)/Glu-tRNA(Gln) amidotransferase A subunit family amidase